jgi:hypothetical protein
MSHAKPVEPDKRSLHSPRSADTQIDLRDDLDANLSAGLVAASYRIITQIRHDRLDLLTRTSDNPSTAYDSLARTLDELQSAVHHLVSVVSPQRTPVHESTDSTNHHSNQPSTEL